jgi:hypothetical protein
MQSAEFSLRERRRRSIRNGAILLGAFAGLAAGLVGVQAQTVAKVAATDGGPAASEKTYPPRPAPPCCGYPFPRSSDAEIADGAVHIVHYEDTHVMFLEVANPPLLDIHMHGHPYASVFTHDSNTGAKNPDAPPRSGPAVLDATSSYNDMGSTDAPGPNGAKWPTCTPAAPQAPHRPFNTNVAPNHFYRLEFLRLDGTDLADHWKEWYPEMAAPEKPVKDVVSGPALGPKFSADWPYPIAYDEINAAPNNYKLLFENNKLRLLEVFIRPGETTPMHGTPYSYIMAFNSVTLNSPDVTDKKLDAASALNGQGAGVAGPPKTHNLTEPTCMTMAARAPHAIHNGGTVPLHYYQIEYKRIDGDGLTANWKQWYPWMQYMQSMR